MTTALPKQMSFELRDPATGLYPPKPLPATDDRGQRERRNEALGTVEGRVEFAQAHGYDIDAVLAASNEFRRHVGGAGFPWMVRGEAIHIARALEAVRDV